MRTNLSKEDKECSDCKLEFVPNSNRQKRCTPCGAINKEKVRKAYMDDYHKKKKYVKKGYTQAGTSNNNWKGGIATYRTKVDLTQCQKESCQEVENLLVHHKDENRCRR